MSDEDFTLRLIAEEKPKPLTPEEDQKFKADLAAKLKVVAVQQHINMTRNRGPKYRIKFDKIVENQRTGQVKIFAHHEEIQPQSGVYPLRNQKHFVTSLTGREVSQLTSKAQLEAGDNGE